MSFPSIFGPGFLAGVIRAPSLLPPDCTSTTTIRLPAVTSVNSLTFTYTGPFTGNTLSPFKRTTTTYTIVIPTIDPNGAVERRTYTIVGAPLDDSNPQTPRATTTVTTTRVAPAVTVTAQCQGLSTDVPPNPYVGCVEDSNLYDQPLLDGPRAVRNTQESCKAFCTTTRGGPYNFFGIEGGTNCQCGNGFLHSPIRHPGECRTPCAGNDAQECGGSNRMSIWQNTWPGKDNLIPNPPHQSNRPNPPNPPNSPNPPHQSKSPNPRPPYQIVDPPFGSPPGDGVIDDPWTDLPDGWQAPHRPPFGRPPSWTDNDVDEDPWAEPPYDSQPSSPEDDDDEDPWAELPYDSPPSPPDDDSDEEDTWGDEMCEDDTDEDPFAEEMCEDDTDEDSPVEPPYGAPPSRREADVEPYPWTTTQPSTLFTWRTSEMKDELYRTANRDGYEKKA